MSSTIARLDDITHEYPTPEDVARHLADWITEQALLAVANRARFSIALAGGSTPTRTYRLLAEEPYLSRLDWSRWHVYFGDERACPQDDPASNHQMAAAALLSRVPIRPEQVYRMRGESQSLDAEARRYAQLLELTLGRPPRFDVALLGLGTNGHTASLFPGTAALESTSWCTEGFADYEPVRRLTLTFAALNAARQVAFVVTGAEKGEALRETALGKTPASRVRPGPHSLHWFVDAAAHRAMMASSAA